MPPEVTVKKTMTPLLDSLSDEQAAQVLYLLSRSDPGIALRAEAIARDFLEDIDYEEIADGLYNDLDYLEIDDVWDSSGRKRDGSYIEPGERAHEMMEEVVTPLIEEMKEYVNREMPDQACEFCKGILLGLSRFENESGSDLLEETPDSCSELIDEVRSTFSETVNDTALDRELSEFCDENGLD
jgi:hypothetical protein